MESTSFMKRDEIAKILGVAPASIPSAIINGTLPVGAVFEGAGEKGRTRTVIVRARWERWLAGKDLEK